MATVAGFAEAIVGSPTSRRRNPGTRDREGDLRKKRKGQRVRPSPQKQSPFCETGTDVA